jgi:hypothetical protein
MLRRGLLVDSVTATGARPEPTPIDAGWTPRSTASSRTSDGAGRSGVETRREHRASHHFSHRPSRPTGAGLSRGRRRAAAWPHPGRSDLILQP